MISLVHEGKDNIVLDYVTYNDMTLLYFNGEKHSKITILIKYILKENVGSNVIKRFLYFLRKYIILFYNFIVRVGKIFMVIITQINGEKRFTNFLTILKFGVIETKQWEKISRCGQNMHTYKILL